MIKLRVADYCQSCPEFEPCATKNISMRYKDGDPGDEEDVTTTITCSHELRCRSMKTFIDKHQKNMKEK